MPTERPVGPILNGLPSQVPDVDPEETAEWRQSLAAAVEAGGKERARYLMLRLLERSRERQIGVPSLTSTDYVNTIAPGQEPEVLHDPPHGGAAVAVYGGGTVSTLRHVAIPSSLPASARISRSRAVSRSRMSWS